MLYIIPTPLGNLEDITARATKELSACDFVIAENPSQAHKLFQLLGLPKKEVTQFAEHNELKALPALINRLQTQTACLVSDAGMPGIADPGFRLVRACREENINVVALPGPNAAITALAGSGLPTDKFLFVGFFPKTEPKLLKIAEEAKHINATLVAYESPQRVNKTLSFFASHFPQAKIALAREISKLHEEYITGTALEISAILESRESIKGEITLVISFK